MSASADAGILLAEYSSKTKNIKSLLSLFVYLRSTGLICYNEGNLSSFVKMFLGLSTFLN